MGAVEAVLYYLIWMIALALFYAFPRVPKALFGGKPFDSWERDKPAIDPAFMQRAKAAHMNCVENFPLFLAVVAMAAITDQLIIADSVASFVLYARVAQSLVHISGTSFVQIMTRATLFLVQLALIVYIAVQLL